MTSRYELKEIIRNSGIVDYDLNEDKLNEITDRMYSHEQFDPFEEKYDDEDDEYYNYRY